MSRFVFLIFYLSHNIVDAIYLDFLQPDRISRHCRKNGEEQETIAVQSLEGGRFTLSLTFVSILIFLLITLGFIKGMLGLWCFPKFGSYGLNLLIDLPRPLSQYQENELRYRPVIYDVGGWPVHPDTEERTVRVMTKRTEFCLNLIFFLACPMAVVVYMCSLCCCIKNYSVKSSDDTSFKKINVVRLTSFTKYGHAKDCPMMDVYKEDGKEEEDTRYVIDVLKKSRESINEIRGQ